MQAPEDTSPELPEGLIIPEGFEVNEIHLMVLEFLEDMIIPKD